jgi:hypothetical protein
VFATLAVVHIICYTLCCTAAAAYCDGAVQADGEAMDAASEQLQMCLEAVFSSDRVPEDMVTKVYVTRHLAILYNGAHCIYMIYVLYCL